MTTLLLLARAGVSQPSDILSVRAAAAGAFAEAWSGGIASAVLIGAFAGLLPAVRAFRMAPTEALRTV